MSDSLTRLLGDIRACQHCADLPLGPRPVLQANASARLRIVGQAPGRRVHETGVPWDDASGVRLRDWLGLTPTQFYDSAKVAIVPMGFCYPGRALSGDNPPRRECAPRWHRKLDDELRGIELTVLVGHYAIDHYLADRKPSLAETIRDWERHLAAGWLPLPHPSPRNQPWLARNEWFEAELVPHVQAVISGMSI